MTSSTRPSLPWEPEALELPLERPVPRPQPRWRSPDDDEERRDGERAGSYVIVIDIA